MKAFRGRAGKVVVAIVGLATVLGIVIGSMAI